MKSLNRITTADGSHSILSDKFGVSYHSIHGALQETQHVFINAGLKLKALTSPSVSILDIGFGTGLNAFATILEARRRNLTVYYHAVEAFPLEFSVISGLNYPALLGGEEETNLFESLHTSEWGAPLMLSDTFTLFKDLSLFQELEVNKSFDLIYYDAFAPSAQPELWEEPILSKMYELLGPDGVLVTYCAKGVFKRTLKAVGFTVEALPGPPGKREMTRAIKLVHETG
ncbi:MAG: tRNA (5-methylaminomethyl-2-thiouridine)(34)-methyltransferase MnmD [Bacteroidota bacterium]